MHTISHRHRSRQGSRARRHRRFGARRLTPPPSNHEGLFSSEPARLPLVLILPPVAQNRAEPADAGPNLVQTTADDGKAACLVMSVEVPASVAEVYEAWTRFDLPCFMKGTRQLDYFDGARMTWRVRTLFDQFAWHAQACEVVPFQHITWQSTPGAARPNFGSAKFQMMRGNRTRIVVQAGFDMSGPYQWLGSPLPSVSQTLERALLRFYDFVAIQSACEIKLLPVS